MEKTLREYADEVLENLKGLLEPGFTAEVHEVTKDNGELKCGICVHDPVVDAAPMFRLNGKYEFEVPAEEAAMQINRLVPNAAKLTIPNDLAKCRKDLFFPRLVNAKLNPEIEKECASRRVMGDLLLYYVREIPVPEGTASFKITKVLLEHWNITEEEVYEAAMENLSKRGVEMKSLAEFMAERMAMLGMFGFPTPSIPADEIPQMYYVSNAEKEYGATCILLPEVQKALLDKFGSFIIIPSSIHEVLVFPADGFVDPDEMKDMIGDVNDNYLKHEALLSNHAYIRRWNESEIEPYDD